MEEKVWVSENGWSDLPQRKGKKKTHMDGHKNDAAVKISMVIAKSLSEEAIYKNPL